MRLVARGEFVSLTLVGMIAPMIVAYEKGEPVFTARPDASSVREADGTPSIGVSTS